MKIKFCRITPSKVFSWLIISLMLVPAGSFAQDSTWFHDVTGHVGLYGANASSVIAVDVNNDDYPDLILLGPVWKLYLNEQNPNDKTGVDRIFVDATDSAGFDAVPLKDFACAADFNNDGNVDLLTNRWWHNSKDSAGYLVPNADDGSRLHLLLGDGKGHFTLMQNSGLEALGPMAGVGLPILDYDKDGNLDIYVANHYAGWFVNPGPSFLMHGNGDGTFTNTTTSAGINTFEEDSSKPWEPVPPYRAFFGANMADWNNDCWPDILALPYEAIGYPATATHCQYYYGNNNYQYAPCNEDTQDTRGYGVLYRNNTNNTFTDVGVTKNFDTHFAWADQGMVPWAAMPCDYNNDGYVDFLVLEVHGANYAAGSPYNYPAEPGNGRTCIFTNLGPDSGYKLSPNVGQIVRNAPQNITHGDHNGFWSDFDNDGWVDLTVGDAVYAESGYPDNQRMTMCRQDPTTHIFNDITGALGFIKDNVVIDYRIRRPSVMIPVDFDMDGDDDILKTPYSPGQDSLLLLRNDIGNKSNHIEIKLIAPPGVNKSCVGARITVKAGGIKQMREVYANQGSQTNQYPFTQNFGIGHATNIDSIDVRWPDLACSHTVVTNVEPNHFIYIDGAGINAVHNVPSLSNNFILYPNPNAENILSVQLISLSKTVVDLYNSLGQKINSFVFDNGNNNLQIPVGNLTPGMYWVHLTSKGINGTKPFVKVSNQ